MVRERIFMAVKSLHNEKTDALFKVILSLNDIDECYAFFEDLCTVKEVLALSQRLAVADRLEAGCSYHQTIDATGACSATISRVKTCLDYGAGGYRMILDRIDTQEGV